MLSSIISEHYMHIKITVIPITFIMGIIYYYFEKHII